MATNYLLLAAKKLKSQKKTTVKAPNRNSTISTSASPPVKDAKTTGSINYLLEAAKKLNGDSKIKSTSITSGIGVSGQGSFEVTGDRAYTADELLKMKQNQTTDELRTRMQSGTSAVPAFSELEMRMAQKKQQLENAVNETQEKLDIWSNKDPLADGNSKARNRMLLSGQTPAALEQQMENLQKELNKPEYITRLKTFGEMRQDAALERYMQGYSTMSDGMQDIGYLLENYSTGVSDWAGGFVNAVDAVLPNTDLKGNSITYPKIESYRNLQEMQERIIDRTGDLVSDGVEQYGGKIARGLGYATPNAVMAMIPGMQALSKGAGLLGKFQSPLFWTTAISTYGNSYASAKAEGATEEEAQLMAILNGFVGALTEVSGGLEKIPQSSSALLRWIRSTLEEGGEEVIQGIIEQIAQKITYEQEKEWFSLTNPDAVINPYRMAEEFGTGLAVSAILSGGQNITKAVTDYTNYVTVGNKFLTMENGVNEALQIGLSNPKGTDVYQAATSLQTRTKNNQPISAYQIGRMVTESTTPAAQQARQLDTTVRESGAQHGVDKSIIDDVAAISVKTGRNIVFGELADTANGNAVGGQYDPNTGVITVNAKAAASTIVDFLVKHELTHSVEGTKQWSQLADIVEAQMGDEAWSAALAEVMEKRGLDLPQAEREVVADWVGDNLYKSGFANAIVDGNVGVGNAFVRTLDRLRLALGNKKSRANTNLAVVERLFMRALEQEQTLHEGDVEYAFIGSLKDGTRVYESDVDSSLSEDEKKQLFKDRIATIFNLGAVELKTNTKKILVRGDKFTASKNAYGDKRATESEMDAKYRMLYEFADILQTARYIPQKTAQEPSYINPNEKPKNAAHKDVKYWYKFENDIVLDDVGYTVTFNIRDKGKEQYQYLIDIKENGYTVSHTAIEGLRRAYRASVDKRIAHKKPLVNTQSMQNGKNNTQNAIVNRSRMEGDTSVDRMGNAVDAEEQAYRDYLELEKYMPPRRSEATPSGTDDVTSPKRASDGLTDDEYFRMLQRYMDEGAISEAESSVITTKANTQEESSSPQPLTNTSKKSMVNIDLQLFAEKDIKNQESISLKRAMRKYNKLISEHQQKINNPAQFVEDWDSKHVREQEGLKKHWQKEIRNFQTSIDARIAELKDRGDYDE